MAAHHSIAPGWGMLRYENGQAGHELLTLATGDVDEAVRAGAFEMLEPAAIDAWLARDEVTVDRQLIFDRFRDQANEPSASVRDQMIALAQRMGGDEAQDFLAVLAHRDATKNQAEQALIGLQAARGSERAFELLAQTDVALDDRTLIAVRAAAAQAGLGVLQRLATAPDDRVRMVAVQLFASRGDRGGAHADRTPR